MEIWKQVCGYEGIYEVSSKGKVRSLDRYITNKNGKQQFYPGKILGFDITVHPSSSYARVTLSKNHKSNRQSVHRLVASAFIPNPNNHPHVNHLDNNGLNNSVENIEWVTHSENMIHAQKQGRLFNSQSKGGKLGSYTNHAKMLSKLETIVGTNVNEWRVLGNVLTPRGAKYYTDCQCSCGTVRPIEIGRLFRRTVTSCHPCSTKLKI